MKTAAPVAVPMLPEVPSSAARSEAGFGCLRTARGNLPLEAVEVRARIAGLFAHTVVKQTFVNAHAEPLEATYVFPLPDRAAVTGFRMEVAGRVVEGVLKERGEARRDYAEAITAGHRAAIAEEERPGTFTMRVGNLMPGEKATVRLTMTGPLPYDSGEATFRFPLVVAPRYIPGTPLPGESVGDGVAPDTDAVPDASRITPPVLLPGFPNPVRLALSVELDPLGLPVKSVASSLHAVVASDEGHRRVYSVQPGERLDRDFVLRVALDATALASSLAVKPDPEGEGGTFLLTLLPPAAEASHKPRDLAVLLDRSGSMEGWKMVAARRAVSRVVEALRADDRVRVIAFDDALESPPEASGLVPATDAFRFRTVRWLEGVDARGGTELAAPLDEAVKALQGGYEEREKVLVLVTDGQVGNEDQILGAIGKRVKRTRVFTVGIDTAVNEGFLRRLAALGGGACELVEGEDRLEGALAKVQRRIEAPVLSQLELAGEGLAVEAGSVVPARLPDLFPGAPLVVCGRYAGKARGGSLTVKARDASGRPWSATLRAEPTASEAVTLAWARGHVRELEDRFAVSRDASLAPQIVAASLRYGVLSRFTAYVAVDRAEVVNAGGERHRVTQPVELPKGWSPAAIGLPQEKDDEAEGFAPPMGAPEPLMAAAPLAGAASGGSAPSGALPAAPARAMASRGAPSPTKAKASAAPVMRALFGNRTRGEAKADLAEAVELAPYRARAKELAGRVAKKAELGAVRLALEALVEDLRSVGAPEEAVKPLAELLEELAKLLAAQRVEAALAAALARRLEEALRRFAKGKA